MANFKKLGKASFFYIGSNGLSQAISFGLVMVLTKLLSPLQYGLLSTVQSLLPLGETFVEQGSTGSLMRETYDTKQPQTWIYHSIIIKIMFGGIFALVILFLQDYLHTVYHFPLWLIWSLPILCFMTSLSNMLGRFWIAADQATPFTIFQGVRTLFTAGLTLLFLFTIAKSWESRIFGLWISEAIGAFFCIIYLYKTYPFQLKFEFPIFKQMATFGIPLFISATAQWIINLSDRLFLAAWTNLAITGMYSLGYAIASIIEVISGSLIFAAMPHIFKGLNSDDPQKLNKMVHYSYLYILGMFLLTIAWIAISALIIKIFIGPSYHDAIQIIPWIAFAYFFNAIFRLIAQYISFSKKTNAFIYIYMGAALINVLGNIILIPRYGAMGAAQSTFFAFLSKTVFGFILLPKVFPLPWFSALTKFALQSDDRQ